MDYRNCDYDNISSDNWFNSEPPSLMPLLSTQYFYYLLPFIYIIQALNKTYDFAIDIL